MKKLTDQERIDIVRYRIENAKRTLDEVESHIGIDKLVDIWLKEQNNKPTND